MVRTHPNHSTDYATRRALSLHPTTNDMPRGVLSRHTSTSHDATRRALSSHLPRIAQVTKSLAIDAPLCEPSRVTPSPRAFYPLLARLRFLYMGLLNLSCPVCRERE